MKYTRMSSRAMRAGALVLALAVGAEAAPPSAYRSYLRGLIDAKNGDFESALNEYERVVAVDRNAVTVYRDLAFLYWHTGRPEKAFATADRLEEIAGDDLDTQLFLGSFYLLAGKPELARRSWETVLRTDPENETAILYLAAYHSSGNRYAEAADYWEKFIAREPDSAEAYFQLGLTQEKLGMLDRAEASYRKAADLDPVGFEAHLALAQLYEKDGRLQAAAREFERYLELVPDNLSVLMYLGGLYYRMKDYEASEAVFLRARRQKPDDRSVNFWLGVIAETEKDWDGAIRWFEAIGDRDENPAILMRLSYYHSMRRDYASAVACLERAVKLAPDNPEAHYLLGMTCSEMKKYSRAEECFKKALALKPGMEDVHFHLGILYDLWGRFDQAVASLRETISLNPRHAPALNYLGYSFADRDINLDEAEDLIRRALDVEPENGSYIDSLGWVHYRKGRFDEALAELERAAERNPDPIVWEHVGDARMQLGDADGARRAYATALGMDAKNKRLIRKLRAAEKEAPRTPEQSLLDRAVDNILRVSSLRAGFSISGKTPEHNFNLRGVVRYLRPERWRIDTVGNVMAPQSVIVYGPETGLEIRPRALEDTFPAENRLILTLIRTYFSADMLRYFDAEGAKTEKKGRYFKYTLNDATLLVDRKSATVSEYSIEGNILIRFRKYSDREGVLVPELIEMYLLKRRVAATVRLQGGKINGEISPDIFTFGPGDVSGGQPPPDA